MKINGTRVDPSAKYRVTVNNYLSDGGDQLSVLKQGTDLLGGPLDLDALAAYFAKHRPVAPGEPHRIGIKP
jgi:5'-nucleotidase